MTDETEPLHDPAAEDAPRRRPGRPSRVDHARALIEAANASAQGAGALQAAEQAVQEALAEDEGPEMMFDITVQRAQDGGPQDIFLGPNGRTVILKRGERCTVDAGILESLNHAIESFYEADPAPEDPDRKKLVERMRFPYILHRTFVKK